MRESIPVVQIVNQFAIGGAEGQFVERLRRHPRGFRPIVACLRREGPHLRTVEEELGLTVEEFPLRGSLVKANTALQVLRLAALMRREGARLIHAQDFYANCLAVPAARLAGARAIVSRFDLGHWYSKAMHRCEILASRGADAVYANANAVRDLCVHREGVDPARVEVVHNGLDLARFDAEQKRPLDPPLDIPDGPTIAIVANLHPVKGHLDFCDAIALVKRRIPNVRVYSAGSGPMVPAVEARLRELGLDQQFFLLGHRLDCARLYGRVRVAALASHAEGLSNAIIEAMAARLPVVATNAGGNAELVEDGVSGFVVPPRDPEAMARRLVQLLEDAAAARAMGERGRARVETDLTLERMSERTGALYERVLGESVSRAA